MAHQLRPAHSSHTLVAFSVAATSPQSAASSSPATLSCLYQRQPSSSSPPLPRRHHHRLLQRRPAGPHVITTQATPTSWPRPERVHDDLATIATMNAVVVRAPCLTCWLEALFGGTLRGGPRSAPSRDCVFDFNIEVHGTRNNPATARSLTRSPDHWQAHVVADARSFCTISADDVNHSHQMVYTTPSQLSLTSASSTATSSSPQRRAVGSTTVVAFGTLNALPRITISASDVCHVYLRAGSSATGTPRVTCALSGRIDWITSRLLGPSQQAKQQEQLRQRAASYGTFQTTTATASLTTSADPTPPSTYATTVRRARMSAVPSLTCSPLPSKREESPAASAVAREETESPESSRWRRSAWVRTASVTNPVKSLLPGVDSAHS